MVGKRKVDQLRTNIAKMARAAEIGDKEEFQKASQNVPNLLEKTNIQSHIERLEVNGSTKEEYFAKVLRTSTPLDRVYEYLVFKRNLPELLPDEKLQLESRVRDELMVESAGAFFKDGSFTNTDGDTPLLDALALKIGQPLSHVLAPPTRDCLLCHRRLTRNNLPSTVVFFKLDGPQLASKYSWR